MSVARYRIRFRMWLRGLPRSARFWWQRRTRGWDDSVTWNLDAEIARWTLPRLRRFREVRGGHPGDITDEQWDQELGELVWLMEIHASDDGTWQLDTDELRERYSNACRLLADRFGHLWS